MAWMAWLVVHIFFLIGFRNRFMVLFNWAWSYFTYQRGARLITGRRLGLLSPAEIVESGPGARQRKGGFLVK
jgi:NADH dehydrogenase